MTRKPKAKTFKTFKCMASAFTKDGDLQTTEFTVQAMSRTDAFMRASNRVTFDAVDNGLTEPLVHQIDGRFV